MPTPVMIQTHLVTGGAGFIGSHLCDRLLSSGHFVIAIDDFSLGNRENIAQASTNNRFLLIEGDVSCPLFWEKILKEQSRLAATDVIWHMAANSDISAGVLDATVDLKKTFLTSFHTLEAARTMEVKRFVLASTSAVYGELQTPLHEDSAPLNPISNYGAMKLASEAAATALTSSCLDRLWIFRFPNVVGSRSTHGVIHDFVRKLNANPSRLDVLGNGTQCKPYLHVEELLNAMLYVVDHADQTVNRYLIGPQGTTGTTVKHIAESVVRVYGAETQIEYGTSNRGWVGDVPQFSYSIERISALGWQPDLSSDQAIERAIREIVAERRIHS